MGYAYEQDTATALDDPGGRPGGSDAVPYIERAK